MIYLLQSSHLMEFLFGRKDLGGLILMSDKVYMLIIVTMFMLVDILVVKMEIILQSEMIHTQLLLLQALLIMMECS